MWTFTTKTGIILYIGRQSHDLHVSKLVPITCKLSKATLTTGAHCQEVSMWTCSSSQNNKQAAVLVLKETAVCIWNIIYEKVHEECRSTVISWIISAQLCSQWSKWLVLCHLRGTRLLPVLSGDLSSVLHFSFLQLPYLKNSENSFQMTNPSSFTSSSILLEIVKDSFRKIFQIVPKRWWGFSSPQLSCTRHTNNLTTVLSI